MTISANSALTALIASFPHFEQRWQGAENLSIGDDGSFTCHGVFMEFTHFWRDSYESFSDSQLQHFAKILNTWIDSVDGEMSNAVATCFLENIAGELCGRKIVALLAPEGTAIVKAWSPSG